MDQSYNEMEIILVDDGSDDKSGEICDRLSKEDERISVIHKENGGLSDARNAGLDVAKGEYIAFVDSDDYIAPDFIESLVEEIEKNDADVAMCSYRETGNTGVDYDVFECDEHHAFDGEREVYDSRGLLKNLYDANHVDATYFIVAWNKVYKASLWKDVRFPKGKIHEDEATTYLIYEKAKKGVYIRRPLYAYFKMEKSITRGAFNLKRLEWFDALDDRIKHFEDKNDEEMVSYALKARADGAIRYYYPLIEALPEAASERERLKGYVKKEKGNGLGYKVFMFSPSLYRAITCLNRDKKERAYQICFLLLLVWIAFVSCYKLSVKYVDPWDESRHGVNALEMMRDNHLIRSTFMGETDYYNLKPPLSMWSLMISFLIFGKNVFALRFPSVIFYLITCAAAACFVREKTNRAGALATLFLLAGNTTPFLAHMVRAGDADSLYVMLFTLAMIFMMKIRDDERNFEKCGLLLSLAFLTKSFHAGMIAVIGIAYIIATGLIKKISKKEWFRFIYATFIPLVLWAGARFATDGPAFFKGMWETDVLGRSKSGFGSNEAGFTYYFSYYLGKMSGSLQIYLVALIICAIGIIMICVSKKNDEKSNLKDIFIGYALWIGLTVLGFSAVSTKLLWYLYPAVTALLIATAHVTGLLFEKSSEDSVDIRKIILAVVCVTGLVYSVRLVGIFHNYGRGGNATNDFQLLIKETDASGSVRSDKAYVLLKDEAEGGKEVVKWAQQDVFVAEAYGNHYCFDGGIDGAVATVLDTTKRQDAVIFYSNDRAEEIKEKVDAEDLILVELHERGAYSSAMITK